MIEIIGCRLDKNTKQISTMTVTLYLIKLIDV